MRHSTLARETREFSHLDPLSGEHRRLSEDEALVRQAGARAERHIAERALLRSPDRVGENAIDRRLAGRAIFFEPSSQPMPRSSKARQRLAVLGGDE